MSFGPVLDLRKSKLTCKACQDEITHRETGVSFEIFYHMRGPVCGHSWPRFKFYLPKVTENLLEAGMMQMWKPVMEKETQRKAKY
jgi:hypothetical protein